MRAVSISRASRGNQSGSGSEAVDPGELAAGAGLAAVWSAVAGVAAGARASGAAAGLAPAVAHESQNKAGTSGAPTKEALTKEALRRIGCIRWLMASCVA
jgi:hypothetical protein